MTAIDQTTVGDRGRLARRVRNLFDFGAAYDQQLRNRFGEDLPEPPPGWSAEELFRGTVDDLERRARRLRIIHRHVFGQQLEWYADACKRLDLPLL